MAILVAIDALHAAGLAPTSNVRLFFEGEEEAGSPHLDRILSRNAEYLAADAWIIVDGPVHQSGAKQVVFGVRGDMQVDVTVFGPIRPLHSGHYGNWAPNPAQRLARLLTTMKDDTGRVTIAGWYDDVEPMSETERAATAAQNDGEAFDVAWDGVVVMRIAAAALGLPSLRFTYHGLRGRELRVQGMAYTRCFRALAPNARHAPAAPIMAAASRRPT